jgi:hypothetical protein
MAVKTLGSTKQTDEIILAPLNLAGGAGEVSGALPASKIAAGTFGAGDFVFQAALNVGGILSFSTSATYSNVAASIQRATAQGLVLQAVTGSTYDFVLASPGGAGILLVPTGTTTATFDGDARFRAVTYIGTAGITVAPYFQYDGTDLAIGNANAARIRVGNTGVVTIVGGTLVSSLIRRDTVDGSDNSALQLTGGGAVSNTRGAYAEFYGNEHSSQAGNVVIESGNVGTAHIRFQAGNAEQFRITFSGDLWMQPAKKFYYDGGVDTYNHEVSPNVLETIAGGLATFRVDNYNVADAYTRFLIYDKVNAAYYRINVGANGSGGVGFRMLRILN